MSQENLGIKTFRAAEDLEAYRRVKLDGSGDAVYADAGEEFIGITTQKVANDEMVAVALRASDRTFKVVAADSFALGAVLYGAADGKVSDSVSGTAQGIALEAAGGDGEIVEGYLNNGAAGNIGASSIVNEEANKGVFPIIIRKVCNFNGTPDAIAVATAARKLRILDWQIRSLDTTAANITVKNAGTSISTAVLAKGTAANAIVRAASIVEAQAEVASGAAITAESSVASVGVELTIIAVPIA